MVFDLLAAIGLTVGSAIIVAALASHAPSPDSWPIVRLVARCT